MLLLKQSLQAASIIAAIDKPELVYLCEGAAYALNRKAAIMLSPMTEERAKVTPLNNTGNFKFSVTAEAVRSIIKLIPADKLFKGLLECTDVSVNGSTAEWTVSDGRRNHLMKCNCGTYDDRLISGLRKTWNRRWEEGNPAKISALNITRVAVLFDAMKYAGCASSGEEPVWLRCCDDGTVLLRAVNYGTQQRVLGMCAAYDAEEGQMPEWTQWERQLNAKGPLKWSKRKS